MANEALTPKAASKGRVAAAIAAASPDDAALNPGSALGDSRTDPGEALPFFPFPNYRRSHNFSNSASIRALLATRLHRLPKIPPTAKKTPIAHFAYSCDSSSGDGASRMKTPNPSVAKPAPHRIHRRKHPFSVVLKSFELGIRSVVVSAHVRSMSALSDKSTRDSQLPVAA